MKVIKFYLKVGWNFPILIIHELAHAFMVFILKGGFSKISFHVSYKRGIIEGVCIRSAFLDKRDALVSYAPVIVPIITLLLMFTNPLIFGLIFLYQWSTIKILMPSNQDLESARKTLINPFWMVTEQNINEKSNFC